MSDKRRSVSKEAPSDARGFRFLGERGDSQARADAKANRRQAKAQKKYAKQQKKAEKKMLKMERKNTHYPKQVF